MIFDAKMLEQEPTQAPEVGVYIRGLTFEGAKWNGNELADLDGSEEGTAAPVLHLIPTSEPFPAEFYACPIALVRRGKCETLATVPVKTSVSPQFWSLRGASLLV